MSAAETDSPLEQEIERRCIALAGHLGWLSFKGYSRAGGADRIFFKGGRCFLVEFKTKRGKQSEKQKVEQQMMKANGTSYHVVRTIEEFRDVILTEENRHA